MGSYALYSQTDNIGGTVPSIGERKLKVGAGGHLFSSLTLSIIVFIESNAKSDSSNKKEGFVKKMF